MQKADNPADALLMGMRRHHPTAAQARSTCRHRQFQVQEWLSFSAAEKTEVRTIMLSSNIIV